MTDISGFWVGTFAYNDKAAKPVDFDAEITQTAESLTGIITEPNSFRDETGELLVASISGAVSGSSLTFLKSYMGDAAGRPPVTYNGNLAADHQHISGEWNIGNSRGTFEMHRDGPVVGVKAQTTEATVKKELERTKPKAF